MGYRLRAFLYQLKLLLEQLRQFGLMVLLFAGPALPSVLFLLVLALGLIVRNQGGSQETIELILLCLAGQGMLTWTLRSAMLDLQHRQFGLSLAASKRLCTAMDVLLSWLLNPLLLASLAIAGAMNWEQHMHAQHFIPFIMLQVFFGILMLYRPGEGMSALVAGGFICLLPIGLMQSLALLAMIFSLAAVFSLPNLKSEIQVRGMTGFWLQFLHASYSRVLWRIVLAVLLVSAVGVISRHRPDFANAITLIAAMVTALLLSSIQFDVDKKVREWQRFFTQLGKERALKFSQYAVSLVFVTVGGLVFFAIFRHLPAALALLLVAVVLLWFATKRPALYAPAWFFTSALVLAAL